eukprot:COSAG02_NODE_29592_length_566_cov_1.209850_1_plen_142_part_01
MTLTATALPAECMAIALIPELESTRATVISVRRPGTCLEANRTTGEVTAEACNNLTAGQRFFFTGNHGPGAYVNGAHSDKLCLTANCTAHGPKNVTCLEGAPIVAKPCVTQWPGSPIPNTPDPLQIWLKQAEHGEPHTMVLA